MLIRVFRPTQIPVLAFGAFAAWLLVAEPAVAGPYAEGEKILITGVVSDSSGRPIEGLEVLLRGYRRSYDFKAMRKFKRFGKVNRGEAVLTTRTNEKGEFGLEWPWHDFYNRFELEVSVPRPEGETGTAALERVDLSRRIRQGSPVVSALTVENGNEIRGLLDFLHLLNSEDERQVYQRLGKPDKVRRVEFPAHEEVAWWYFERGETYRFRDGALESTETFEPVVPF